MRERIRFYLVAFSLTLAWVSTPLRAQDDPASHTVVVLNDGRVFSGTIEPVGGGYRVNQKSGYVIVPFDQVRLTAKSLPQAFKTLRDAIPKPSTEDHLQLAEWCLKNDLIGQARTEVTQALALEPLRQEARNLLKSIDDQLEPQAPAKKPSTAMTADGFLIQSDRTHAGISPDLHREFVQRIQPLMMNKCGNAHCHGSATKTSFEIASARRVSHKSRSASDDNLAAVLALIDPNQPRQSQLLMEPATPSAHHKDLFLGSLGNQQYRALEAWVAQVAKSAPDEVGPREHIEPTPSLQPTIIQASGMSLDRGLGQTPAIQTANPPEPSRLPMNATQQDITAHIHQSKEAQFLNRIRTETAPDPFDPEVFNRKMHGKSAGTNDR